MLPETEFDDIFPKGPFLIKVFGDPFRIDRKANGGGIFFHVREDIPAKLLSVETLPTKKFLLKLVYGKKWFVSCSYNPNTNNISNHLQTISTSLDLYFSQYDNIIVVGDCNTEIGKTSMNAFCKRYSLSSLIKEPTCYKNSANQSSVNLILTISPRNLQNSSVVETGPSDFHKMIVAVLKTTFQRLSYHLPFMNKELFKAIIHRTRLRIS